ncbi:hypothetical protein VPH35_013767 [Triticum aestivum]
MSSKSSHSISGTAKCNRDVRYYYTEGDDSSGENEDDKCNSESRSKVDHVRAVLNGFTKYKKFMCWEIIFDGLLNLSTIKKVHLKFSTFLVSSTNVKDQCIKMSQDRKLKFYDAHMHKVLGFSCGPRDIDGIEAQTKAASVDFSKKNVGMVGNDSHSLTASENFLVRDMTELSSEAEKACF